MEIDAEDADTFQNAVAFQSSGVHGGEVRTLDLGEQAGLVADQMEPLATDKEITLRRNLESNVLVSGDEMLLASIELMDAPRTSQMERIDV